MFPMLYSINWTKWIVWLLPEILGNMRIAVVCFPDYDVYILKLRLTLNIEIKLLSDQAVFLIWSKSQVKNLNILRTKRAFKVK